MTDESMSYLEALKEIKRLKEAWEKAKDEIIRKARSGQWSEAVIFGMMRAYDIMCKHLEEQEGTNGKIGNDN